MGVGRNDPCHCGSGKKYKKCCLSKDEAARPAYEPPPGHEPVAGGTAADMPQGVAPPPRAPRELTPQEQAQQDRWTAFELADFEGRIALFEQTLAEPDILEADLALEMLLEVRKDAHAAQQRRQVRELLDHLQEQRPADYQACETTYLRWRITEALNDGASDELAALATRMGELAGKELDDFNLVYEQLAWHGRLDALIGALRVGWPLVRESRDVLPWGVSEFANKGAHCAMLDWLERHPDAREVDAELRAKSPAPSQAPGPAARSVSRRKVAGPIPGGPRERAELPTPPRRGDPGTAARLASLPRVPGAA